MKFYLLSLAAIIAFVDLDLLLSDIEQPETRCHRLGRHSARVECVTRWQGEIIKREIWLNLTRLRGEYGNS